MGSGPISRKRDLLAGLPNIAFCTIGACGFIIQASRGWHTAWDLQHLLELLSQLSGAIFLFFQASLFVFRKPPCYRLPGLYPRVLAFLAANFTLLTVLLPRAIPSSTTDACSTLLLLTGTAGSTWCLAHLGKAFAIFPQARSLTRSGPYKFIRHPLYLFEQLSCLGLVVRFQIAFAAPILIIGIILQFPRMRLEEVALARNFPEYQPYRNSVPMILPNAILRTDTGRVSYVGSASIALTALILLALLSWADTGRSIFR